AKTLRAQPDGKVLVTDGPYTETKEHMGGFWILECADIDEALAWAKKGAIACDVADEVRELLFLHGAGGCNGIFWPDVTSVVVSVINNEVVPLVRFLGETRGQTEWSPVFRRVDSTLI